MKEIHKLGLWCGKTGFNHWDKAPCVIVRVQLPNAPEENTEGENARKEFGPHEVGLHLSYRIYTQIQQESPVWYEQTKGDEV